MVQLFKAKANIVRSALVFGVMIAGTAQCFVLTLRVIVIFAPFTSLLDANRGFAVIDIFGKALLLIQFIAISFGFTGMASPSFKKDGCLSE